MLHSPKSVEDIIITNLQKGSLSTVELIKIIQKSRPKTTKQGVYKVLRNLKKEEVTVLHGKRASLSHIWVTDMAKYFNLAKYHYLHKAQEGEDFLSLNDGDKITYNFANPHIADAFWIHACAILAEVLQKEDQIYIYNPHEWFLLARQTSEQEFFNLAKSNRHQVLVTVGGLTFLDRFVIKYFDGEMSQYHMSVKTVFKQKNYYLNIFGDFLIEVWIDKKISEEIEEFYKVTKVFDEKAQEKIKEIVNQKGKNKLVISRNKAKAEKLKKLFRKNFYIKK